MIRALRMMVGSLVPDAITVYKTFCALLCQHISKNTLKTLLTLLEAIALHKKKKHKITNNLFMIATGVNSSLYQHGSLRPASRSVRVASRSHVRVASRSQGKKFETKIFNIRCFLALPTKTSFTTPHHYPKYKVWAIVYFLWQDPFNANQIFDMS